MEYEEEVQKIDCRLRKGVLTYYCDKHEPKVACEIVQRRVKETVPRPGKRPAVRYGLVQQIRCPECKMYKEGRVFNYVE